jgi:hypothetical protein
MNTSLFKMDPPAPLSKNILGAGTAVLAGFALDAEEELLSSLKDVIEQSPFRNMVTPGGFRMSVAMSNCGSLGWVTDRTRGVHQRSPTARIGVGDFVTHRECGLYSSFISGQYRIHKLRFARLRKKLVGDFYDAFRPRIPMPPLMGFSSSIDGVLNLPEDGGAQHRHIRPHSFLAHRCAL